MATRKLSEADLTDDSPMPFGQYRGMPMFDVPATYLHYLYHSDSLDIKVPSIKRVVDYINRNMGALKLENPDLIWTGRK